MDQEREEEEKKLKIRLQEKGAKEEEEKGKRQAKGKATLQGWLNERADIIKAMNGKNIEEEAKMKQNQRTLEMNGTPWDRVSMYIDLKPANYKGSKDVTRMRQVIVAKLEGAKAKK